MLRQMTVSSRSPFEGWAQEFDDCRASSGKDNAERRDGLRSAFALRSPVARPREIASRFEAAAVQRHRPTAGSDTQFELEDADAASAAGGRGGEHARVAGARGLGPVAGRAESTRIAVEFGDSNAGSHAKLGPGG